MLSDITSMAPIVLDSIGSDRPIALAKSARTNSPASFRDAADKSLCLSTLSELLDGNGCNNDERSCHMLLDFEAAKEACGYEIFFLVSFNNS